MATKATKPTTAAAAAIAAAGGYGYLLPHRDGMYHFRVQIRGNATNPSSPKRPRFIRKVWVGAPADCKAAPGNGEHYNRAHAEAIECFAGGKVGEGLREQCVRAFIERHGACGNPKFLVKPPEGVRDDGTPSKGNGIDATGTIRWAHNREHPAGAPLVGKLATSKAAPAAAAEPSKAANGASKARASKAAKVARKAAAKVRKASRKAPAPAVADTAPAVADTAPAGATE